MKFKDYPSCQAMLLTPFFSGLKVNVFWCENLIHQCRSMAFNYITLKINSLGLRYLLAFVCYCKKSFFAKPLANDEEKYVPYLMQSDLF